MIIESPELTQELMDAVDQALPCDYLDCEDWDHTAAHWIVRVTSCPTCFASGRTVLMCEPCKAYRVDAEDGTAVHCECGHIWSPARHAYVECHRV